MVNQMLHIGSTDPLNAYNPSCGSSRPVATVSTRTYRRLAIRGTYRPNVTFQGEAKFNFKRKKNYRIRFFITKWFTDRQIRSIRKMIFQWCSWSHDV